MSKRAWRMAWLASAVAIGCGSQAVEFPAGSGGTSGGTVLSCVNANQCPNSQGCVAGSCASCTDGTQCMPGQSCSNGLCGACTANAQCAAGEACVNGACGGCTSGDQCTEGKACVLGACGACTANAQCSQGKVCIDGKCSCSTNDQCPGGQECAGGVCRAKPSADGGADGGDGGPIVDSGGDAADACVGKPVFKNVVGAQTSFWTSGGKVGIAAGNEMCKLTGADHFCDYAEIRVAQARGELAALPNMTFWVHRTTPEMVGGVLNSGGAGARCVDWTYSTNHLENGEFGTIAGGAVTYDLAPADKLALGTSGSAGSNRLCGGVTRSLLCCHPRCP